MEKINSSKRFRAVRLWAAAACAAALLAAACQRGPALSQEAKMRVQEVQEILSRLASVLTVPVASRDLDKIRDILKDNFAGVSQKPAVPVRRIGVTDDMGSILAEYPVKEQVTGLDFSKYISVVQALQNKKIGQERLFLKNKPEIFIICAPLLDQQKVVGTVWLSLKADEVLEKWGISSEDFLAIDFNK